jgi:hypothetical protein
VRRPPGDRRRRRGSGFVGDAVAIFPITAESELPALTRRVLTALRASLVVADRSTLTAPRRLEMFQYGIGLNVGSVMYRQYRRAERLAFSAAARHEWRASRSSRNRSPARVLTTRDVASLDPNFWRSLESITWKAWVSRRSYSASSRARSGGGGVTG